MKVVILCGGLGTRLREETEFRPKPMVDVGGRPHLVYNVAAPTMFVRDFNIVLVKEFCRAFSNALGANLHVQLVYGEEPHHVAEAIFKCLARAVDMATQIEPRAADLLPSTKGTI